MVHVGGASCGRTHGERVGMCGDVFRGQHHLELGRLTILLDLSFNFLFSIFYLRVLGLY